MKWARAIPAIFLLFIAIPAFLPIVTSGYFPMHDDTQVVRVFDMHQALRSGQFPVRWVDGLGYGYGYPIFNFYNPLPYYAGGSAMFLGLDALAAAKLMFVLPIIGSAIGAYLFSRLFLNNGASIFSATLFLYAPYHAVQIYVRGAVAEYWAYALLPLVFWAIWKRKIVLAGLLLAALITSHNLTALMSIPFILLLMLAKFFEVKDKMLFVVHCLLLAALALGASAFFWLPAIAEAHFTGVDNMIFLKFDPPARHTVSPLQLWYSPWGYGGSSTGTDDGLSFQLGKIHLVGGFAAVVILSYCSLVERKTMKRLSNVTIFCAIGFILSILLILPYSKSVWNNVPLLAYLQFPWRFLTFASLFSSILAVWTIWKVIKIASSRATPMLHRGSVAIPEIATSSRPRVGTPRNDGKYLLFALCSLLFALYSTKFFRPQFKYPTTARALTSRERIVWDVSRRSDEYLPNGFQIPQSAAEALAGSNEKNIELIAKFRKPTVVQRIGNAVSGMTIIGLGLLAVYTRAIHRHVPNVHSGNPIRAAH